MKPQPTSRQLRRIRAQHRNAEQTIATMHRPAACILGFAAELALTLTCCAPAFWLALSIALQ